MSVPIQSTEWKYILTDIQRCISPETEMHVSIYFHKRIMQECLRRWIQKPQECPTLSPDYFWIYVLKQIKSWKYNSQYSSLVTTDYGK